MINVVICDDNEKFSNTFSKVITWFLKGEGFYVNVTIISNYEKDFDKTLELNNQIYILGINNENIVKKIKDLNMAIPILIMNDKCKKKFFDFLSGSTNLKDDGKKLFQKQKLFNLKIKILIIL